MKIKYIKDNYWLRGKYYIQLHQVYTDDSVLVVTFRNDTANTTRNEWYNRLHSNLKAGREIWRWMVREDEAKLLNTYAPTQAMHDVIVDIRKREGIEF